MRLTAYALALPGAAEFFGAWLQATPSHDQHYAPPDPGLLKDYQPKFFDKDDFAALESFTAILIDRRHTGRARGSARTSSTSCSTHPRVSTRGCSSSGGRR
jgi:hypothetical protein